MNKDMFEKLFEHEVKVSASINDLVDVKGSRAVLGDVTGEPQCVAQSCNIAHCIEIQHLARNTSNSLLSPNVQGQ